MHYLEVLVAEATFHGSEALTYASEAPLRNGQLIIVPLRSKQVLGVVVGQTFKPMFAVKSVIAAPTLPALPISLMALLSWMQAYYPAPLGILTQLMLPKELPKKPTAGKPLPPVKTDDLPPLKKSQHQALSAVSAEGLHLLHGETGSGKTRVYIELALRELARKRSSLILTPEIGLTSQLAQDFRAVFGDRVLILHSQLTEVTRQRLWQYILQQTEPLIIIGARSALFSPLRDLGLIVVDEAHETAYKQDQAPYYHTTSVAAKLAQLHHAALVLGSATPLVSDYYLAKAKGRPILTMKETASGTSELQTTVVDLRNRSNFAKSAYLSTTLIAEIRSTLAHREQSLIFLNRRGTARVIFCDTCGWQAVCPRCDIPLVYHGDSHLMRCHSCDYRAASPMSCPVCHNVSVVFKSVGTKAIVSELQRLFPGASIMRFDTDNKKAERIEQHYQALHSGSVDILVGTQTLAKGLDLPRLGLVGVIIADTGLFFPDFSAQERTYQLLSQVVGRVARGHRHGRAVIQTYAPQSALIQAVLAKDWQKFYEKEIVERRTFRFPPFCYLLKLTCRRVSNASAQKAATTLAATLQDQYSRVRVEGPTPAFHEKIQDKFIWQLVIKAANRSDLISIIHNLPSGWSYDIDPMNLL